MCADAQKASRRGKAPGLCTGKLGTKPADCLGLGSNYSRIAARGCIHGPRGCSRVRRPGRLHRAASLAASTRSISGACSNTSRRAASFSNSFMSARHRRLPREPQDPNVGKSRFSDVGALKGRAVPGPSRRAPCARRASCRSACRRSDCIAAVDRPRGPTRLEQGVDVHVRLVPASASRDDSADAVHAHVRQRHWSKVCAHARRAAPKLRSMKLFAKSVSMVAI